MRPAPSRRAVLATPAAWMVAAALGGCTSSGPQDPERPARTSSVPVDPDVALRAAAAERERALLRAYDAALLGVPSLRPRLGPLRSHHVAHLAALLGPAPSASAASPATATSAASTAEPAPSDGASRSPAIAPPVDAAAALAGLVAAERAAGTAHAEASLTASRSLAGVLASLSASELSHPVALA